MATDRMIITVEFKKTNEDDIKIYEKLKGFSSPQGIIKDILKGKLPLELILSEIKVTKNEVNKDELEDK